MSLEYNEYYNLINIGDEATRLSETLLQSYPVTRACLGILGKKLSSQLEFGFFSAGTDIILQGKRGKDLFLLCENTVDVLVDNQRVVQMNAPALFGDKGIVEPKSTRAATIRVAEENTCLFLKIPMGLFIRNVEDMDIPDHKFSQETGIFYTMFKGIQSRLFEFAFIQKNLWEEVNTTLNLLNTQNIVKSLDNRTEQNWDKSIWNAVRKNLIAELNFHWPNEIPLDISTFRNILREHLDTVFPRDAFKGKDADYIKQKHQLWRKWLASVANQIIRLLPTEQLPVNIGEVQLFNPRNYQLRIQGLIKAIEKKFLNSNKKKNLGKSDIDAQTDEPEIKSFFGRSEKNNTFDLKRYLSSFENKFDLKFPQRMQTQIAQRTALVAAKCENEFNKSVAGMKEFLIKAQTDTSTAYKTKKDSEDISITKELGLLQVASSTYNRKLKNNPESKVGVVSYQPDRTPTIIDLIKCSTSKTIRQEMDSGFRKILSALDIQSRLLSLDFIKNHLFICESNPGFEVPTEELEKHYWIPLSSGIRLMGGHTDYGPVKPGSVIGGKGWMHRSSKDDDADPWKLKMPERKPSDPMGISYLLMVLPQNEFPWEQSPQNDQEEINRTHLPIMQWMVNKQIEHILQLLPKRDTIFHNWIKTEQIVKLEQKVKDFENTRVEISPGKQLKIMSLLDNVLGLKLDKKKKLASDQLSKKIYNHILQQMMIDFSEIPIEELGNKTYTKWRLVLSEIIQILESSDISKTANSATPVFEIIEIELFSMLDSFAIPKIRESIQLTHHTPYIQLPRIMASLENPEMDGLLLFHLTQSILETYLRLLFEEIQEYKYRYQQAYSKRPQTDTQIMEITEILNTVQELKKVIHDKTSKKE
ncbi:cyclic nucleotide-binding domain-containing protein [bacterium]|nr:cyclic nucleotide-binding domain-containing protein [bacterium]